MKLGWIVKLHLSHLFFSKIVLNLVLNMHNKGVLIGLQMLISGLNLREYYSQKAILKGERQVPWNRTCDILVTRLV